MRKYISPFAKTLEASFFLVPSSLSLYLDHCTREIFHGCHGVAGRQDASSNGYMCTVIFDKEMQAPVSHTPQKVRAWIFLLDREQKLPSLVCVALDAKSIGTTDWHLLNDIEFHNHVAQHLFQEPTFATNRAAVSRTSTMIQQRAVSLRGWWEPVRRGAVWLVLWGHEPHHSKQNHTDLRKIRQSPEYWNVPENAWMHRSGKLPNCTVLGSSQTWKASHTSGRSPLPKAIRIVCALSSELLGLANR